MCKCALRASVLLSKSEQVHRCSGPVLLCRLRTITHSLSVRCCTAWCNALQCTMCAVPHYIVRVVLGEPATQHPNARGQWAVEFLQCTDTLPGGNGQWNSYNALVGSGTPAMHRHTACDQ